MTNTVSYLIRCPAELNNMAHSILFSSLFSCEILINTVRLHGQTVQILIMRLLQKPADLELHCFLKWIYPGQQDKE